MNRTLVLALAFAVGASAVALTAVRVVADDSAKPPVAPPAAPPAAAPDAVKTAKDEKVRKLLRLQGTEAQSKLALDKMIDTFKQMPGLPKGFAETFRAKANVKDMMELSVPSYSKNLDDATLDAVIAFYETPAGKDLASKMPVILTETMDAGIVYGRKLGAEVAAELLDGK